MIPVAEPVIGSEELECVRVALESGWISSQGPHVAQFERGFAELCGTAHAATVCNGTAALHLVLQALGVGPGDEVVVPDLTFVSPAHAVVLTGATPVLADVEPHTWCVDPMAVERALTPATKAVIGVDLYGQLADFPSLRRVIGERQITLIEDAAEAHGAELNGTKAGALADVACFSFYANKLITTGEGGMITTSDANLFERVTYLRGHGMRPAQRYFHDELAFNYRMSNLQAAVGVAQLSRFEHLLRRKREIFALYNEMLGSRAELTLNSTSFGEPSHWMVSAIVHAGKEARDALCETLRSLEVDTRPFFMPMSELPHLAKYRRCGVDSDDTPVARRLGACGFNLPSGCGLTNLQVQTAARAVCEALDS